MFTLSGASTRFVHLHGTGQLAVEAEQGKISIYGNGVQWASNRVGHVVRRWLPAGIYAVTLTGTYGRAVLEPDVYNHTSVRTVSDGVTWTRRIGTSPTSSVNMLTVQTSHLDDLDVYDDDMRCRSVPSMGRRAGATAGVNGTFYATSWPLSCQQDAGAIRYDDYAHGNVEGPIISFPSGTIETVDDIWDAQGPSAISGSHRVLPYGGASDGGSHPRTIIGRTGSGAIAMMTIDGRTPAGTSVTVGAGGHTGRGLGDGRGYQPRRWRVHHHVDRRCDSVGSGELPKRRPLRRLPRPPRGPGRLGWRLRLVKRKPSPTAGATDATGEGRKLD